jgi:hypothetical protein
MCMYISLYGYVNCVANVYDSLPAQLGLLRLLVSGPSHSSQRQYQLPISRLLRCKSISSFYRYIKVEVLTPTRAVSDCLGMCKTHYTAKVPMYTEKSMSSPIVTMLKNWTELDWVTYITGMTSQLAAAYDPATPQR